MTQPNSSANVVFERHRNELDITEGARFIGLGSVWLILFAGVIAAALFGSGPLNQWVFEISFTFDPDSTLGPVVGLLLDVTSVWHGWMVDLGTAGIYDTVRERMQELIYG